MMVDMKGFVEYEDKQYPFSFSDSTLNLYPDKFDSKSIEEWFAPYERGEVIENIQLHGITANRKNVIFEVSEQYSDQEGFLSFDVYSIFEYDSARYQPYIEDGKHKYNVKKTKIRGIKLSGVDVDIFYPPENAYFIETSKKQDIVTKVGVNRIVETPLGLIEWNGVKIELTAQYKVKQSFSPEPLHSTSEIIASFSEDVSFDFAKEIYLGIYQVFRYVMRRNNIAFNNIEIFDINEKNVRDIFGKFYDLKMVHEKENNSKIKRRVLSYDYIGEKLGELLKAFLEGIIYIDHLPDSIDKTNKFGPDRMIFDFVAFEREYANLYPETEIRSEKYLQAKNDAINMMDKLINERSGKVKKYLTTFRKRIAADENSLADRILVVIKDCLSIMEPFLVYELGKEYNIKVDEITPLENIASKMNTLRNDMAHGNLDIQLDKDHIFGFEIIEVLLYAMRLKAVGIEDRKIQEGIIKIMGFNFALD